MCVNICCVPVEIRRFSVASHVLHLVRAVISSAASALFWRPEKDAASFLARPIRADVAGRTRGPGPPVGSLKNLEEVEGT